MGNTATNRKSEQQHRWLIWKKLLDLLKQNFLKVVVTGANLRKPHCRSKLQENEHANHWAMVGNAEGWL